MHNRLGTLHTPLGIRDLYDSVCFCNRCGMCAPVCPAYAADPQESNSPRARNQALRLLLENKLKNNTISKELNQLITSCTLCGRCTHVCPGQIPTAEHILELRRLLKLQLLPRSLFKLLRLRETSPRLFYAIIRIGLLSRRIGLLRLTACMPGFAWVKHLLQILPTRSIKPFAAKDQKRPTLIYLPSLEAEFLFPDLAQHVYNSALKKYRVIVWQNTTCGLFEYLYGDVRSARKILRRLILQHQQTANTQLPILTDSIDVYHFLKRSAQLFHGFTAWEEKALHFAQCVRFVTDIFPQKPSNLSACKKPVLFMNSAVFTEDSALQTKIEKKLQTLFKKNLVQCGYKDACIAPAGYGFIKGSREAVYNLQAVRTVATHQAQTVIVLSGLAQLELNFQLRQFYPTAHAQHIANLNG
ncbi:MAG: (Fe-S)-binding protein [Elusimicrobiaceae bacterium]|nr:(Fe-S)-binding protein [Elusimicrobiaceae bacterium]